MSPNTVAFSLLPFVFVFVLLLECSRLRSACTAQRRHVNRHGDALAEEDAPETDGIAPSPLSPFAD